MHNDANSFINSLECSLHTLPKPLLREFTHVFGHKYKERHAFYWDRRNNQNTQEEEEEEEELELLAIATNQRALKDLVAIGDDVEAEKDRLLHVVRMSLDSENILVGLTYSTYCTDRKWSTSLCTWFLRMCSVFFCGLTIMLSRIVQIFCTVY